MAQRDTDRLWAARLRWRLRGASQWPVFVLALVVDAILLHVLPIAGEGGGSIVGTFLLAGFLNLAVVAVLAPVAGRLLQRRCPALPLVIAQDRAGTGLLVALTLALGGIGLAHHPTVRDARDDFGAQASAARDYISRHGAPQYRRNLDRLNTVKPGPDVYRTCAPGSDPRRWLCVYVFTDRSPPRVELDRDHQPNSRIFGPDNPGRRGS
jgi:hypothetical protein